VVESVRKTHHLVVVEETSQFGGFAGEVVSQVQRKGFDYLNAPIERVAGEEVPIPYSMPLERLAIPDAQRVAQAARLLLLES
jgi:pyruvate/2-oxoglutarate/acetoin dehydrogenase E1 component